MRAIKRAGRGPEQSTVHAMPTFRSSAAGDAVGTVVLLSTPLTSRYACNSWHPSSCEHTPRARCVQTDDGSREGCSHQRTRRAAREGAVHVRPTCPFRPVGREAPGPLKIPDSAIGGKGPHICRPRGQNVYPHAPCRQMTVWTGMDKRNRAAAVSSCPNRLTPAPAFTESTPQFFPQRDGR